MYRQNQREPLWRGRHVRQGVRFRSFFLPLSHGAILRYTRQWMCMQPFLRYLFFFGLGVAGHAQAPQEGSRWRNLSRLPPSTAIRAELTSGATFAGTIGNWDGNRFTLLARDGQAVPLERDAVRRLSRRSRARGALYGFLAGFGAGFVTGTAAGAYITDYGNPSALRRVQYGIGFGAFAGGIGAAIGALAGARISIYP